MEVISSTTKEAHLLLKELERSNIKFAFWKGTTNIQNSLTGKSDIELLLNPSDRIAFESILQKLSFKKVKSQAWETYPYVEDWVGFDYDTGILLHIHTHYSLVISLSYGVFLNLPWNKIFFQNLVVDQNTGWPIPKPALEAIILLIKIGAKIKFKPHKESEILGSKLKEINLLFNRVQPEEIISLIIDLDISYPKDFEILFNSIAANDNTSKESFKRLALQFYYGLPKNLQLPKIKSSVNKLYYKYYLKYKQKLTKYSGPTKFKKTVDGGGKIFAIIGSDGSGKSTLSNDIIKWFTFKIDTHYFYFGKAPFIKTNNQKIISKIDLISSKNVFSKVLKKVIGDYYYLILIKHKQKMLNEAKKLSGKGSVVICDRFPQKDFFGFNDGPRLQKNKNEWVSKKELKVFDQIIHNGADIIFRLKVTPELAHTRKPEHNFDIIKKKCESINKLNFPNSRIIDFDSSKPYEDVLLEVKREIWKNI